MTDPLSHKSMAELPHQPILASRKRTLWKSIATTFIVALVCISVLISYLSTPVHNQSPANIPVVSVVAPLPPSPVAEDQGHISVKEDSLEAPPLIHRSLEKISNNDDTTADVSDNKVSELEKNVAVLTATIAVLQNELQNRNLKLEQTQQANQTTLAVVLAFFQLRDQALSGHAFASEYQTLFRVSRNMPDHFQEQLRQLQSLATKDVPNADTLRENLKSLEPKALQAIQKEKAATWVDRIKVALSSLISIRRLNDHETSDVFASLEQGFAENNLSSVQAAVETLPPAAQAILESWKNALSVRNQINTLVYDMSNDLIEQNLTPSLQQDKKP